MALPFVFGLSYCGRGRLRGHISRTDLEEISNIRGEKKEHPKVGGSTPFLEVILEEMNEGGLLWTGFKRRVSVRTDGVVGGI